MLLKFKNVVGLIFVAGFITSSQAAVISCPAQLPSDIEQQTHWQQWNVTYLKKSSNKPDQNNILISSDILEGVPGDEKKSFPSLLAPDQEEKVKGQIIQTWQFQNSKKRFLLICHYRNSDVYLSAQLPTTIAYCKQTLTITSPESDVPSGVTIKSIDCY